MHLPLKYRKIYSWGYHIHHIPVNPNPYLCLHTSKLGKSVWIILVDNSACAINIYYDMSPNKMTHHAILYISVVIINIVLYC